MVAGSVFLYWHEIFDFIAKEDCSPLRAFGTCRAEKYFLPRACRGKK